jgi:hypothetical protein
LGTVVAWPKPLGTTDTKRSLCESEIQKAEYEEKKVAILSGGQD